MKGKLSMFLLISILGGWQATQIVIEAANPSAAAASLQKEPLGKVEEKPSPKSSPKNSPGGAKPSPTKPTAPKNSNSATNAASGQTDVDKENQPPPKMPSETREADENETKITRQVSENKNKTDAANSGGWFVLPSWTLSALAGVFLLGAAALFWYLFRRVEQRRIALASAVNLMQQKHEILHNNFEKLKSEAVALAKQVGEQKLQINALKHSPPTTSVVRPESSYGNDLQRSDSAQTTRGADVNQTVEPDPVFPVSVDAYLKSVGRGVSVKYDYKTDLLTENHDGESPLVVVRDDTIPGGLHYVVPRFGVFQTGNDFVHVKNYYSCPNPTGGTIWIKQPAVVERADGGWQLTLPGELEVK